ncbi:zeta toxin family protein [Pseudomonas sp. LB3P93]
MVMPRFRIFAGPNGSGKSTIKGEIDPALIKTYVNADDLEKEAKETGFIELATFEVTTTLSELLTFHAEHYLIKNRGLSGQAEQIGLLGTKVDYRNVNVNSYLASVISDFLRQRLLEKGVSFTFETVMSHRSKVDFMREAQARGYRTYLYFVSTENPAINIDRVGIRVREGGHPVAPEKVSERYYKSLGLLPDAIAVSNRAYIFDNSGDSTVLLAEITDGISLEFQTNEVPDWFFESYVDKVETA